MSRIPSDVNIELNTPSAHFTPKDHGWLSADQFVECILIRDGECGRHCEDWNVKVRSGGRVARYRYQLIKEVHRTLELRSKRLVVLHTRVNLINADSGDASPRS